MRDEWENPKFAIEWDQTNLQHNPSRTEQLDMLISLLTNIYQEGTTILDLGIGSGLVENQIFARLPNASVVGVDSSAAMLSLAQQRLAAFARQCTFIQHDFADMASLVLPARAYQCAISVQALHHIPHQRQQALFQFVADLLPPNSIFLNMDRVDLDVDHFSGLYRVLWEHLEEQGVFKNNLNGEEFLQRLRSKDDYPALLETQLSWLKDAGFSATCLHLSLNRALIVGVKQG
jgi:tRNA (cmo5U34)-methyltransferase